MISLVSMENIESRESVKSLAESNFKMCLIINRSIEGFYDKDILQIFSRSLQLVCKFNKKSRIYGTSDLICLSIYLSALLINNQ